ncbi:DNA-directed RNA polymerase subunit beta [Streptococcus dentasini]
MSNVGWGYVKHQLGLVLLVVFLCLFVFVLGLILGYAVLGQGHNPLAILSPEKWQSLVDKFTGR